MANDLVPLDPTPDGCYPAVPELPSLPQIQVTPATVYEAFLADSKMETTRQAREWDLSDFAKFMDMEASVACTVFVSGTRGQAVAVVKAYRAWLIARKKAAATTNRRLSTLRSLAQYAADVEITQPGNWQLGRARGTENLKEQPFRDTRGPGHTGWLKVLEEARHKAAKTDVGRRDLVILRLLHDHMLRLQEVVELDLGDVDLEQGRVRIRGKGHSDKEPITLNSQTTLALLKWLDVRGDAPGPLFTRMDRARSKHELERIQGDGVRKMTVMLGRLAGLSRRTNPHGFRHQGVTRILELTNGNVAKAQRAARHVNPATTQRYNDNRQDVAGEMAQLLGDDA